MSVQDDARADAAIAIDRLKPLIEGWSHLLEQGDLSPTARAALMAIQQNFTTQQNAAHAVTLALDVLIQTGYPDLPKSEVPGDVYQELVQNRTTMEAAFGKLVPEPAAESGTMTLDEPTPKTQP